MSAREIINIITQHPCGPATDVLANDLLRAFARGHPLDELKPMLSSDDIDVQRIGAWILSELGSKATPLLGEIEKLLSCADWRIRFWIVDAVLMCVGPGGGHMIAEIALMATDDPESAMRWKAMDFLTRASNAQLRSAIAFLEKDDAHPAHVIGLQGLINERVADTRQLVSLLMAEDPAVRKYAAVAAVRARDADALSFARSVSDEDIRGFAADRP